MAEHAQNFFLGQQPILDSEQQLVAYELLFRSGRHNSARIVDGQFATATVIDHVFSGLGLEAALGPYSGFVNFDSAMLLSDTVEMLPPEKFVLEILETVDITPEIVTRCRELKQKGFRLALDDFVILEDRYRPLLELADIVKVDVLALDPPRLAQTAATLKNWPVRLLAEKVDSEVSARRCREMGFELFQGYYFAKPTIIEGKKLNPSQVALLRLLGLILDDADSAVLESVVKQDPGLSINLLRLTNSAATGVGKKVSSIRHAITMVGRRQLQRWLQLLLYARPSANGKIANPLLQLAASRGRLMELLAARLDHRFEDDAFVVGIMSLMPALMGVAIGEILDSLNMASGVRAALEQRAGVLGALLCLAESLQEGDADGCRALLARFPNLDEESVNASIAQALAWANGMGNAA